MGKKNKGSRPRRHHALPRCYLAGFTASGKVEDSLWESDIRSHKQRRTTPDGTAFERDLYRLDSGEGDPFAAEEYMGSREGLAVGVTRSIAAGRAIPSADDFFILLEFIAMMAVRMPALRNLHYAEMAPFREEMLKGLEAHPGQDGVRDTIAPDGTLTSVRFSQDEIRQWLHQLRDRETFTHNVHMPSVLSQVPKVIPDLAKRKWAIFRASEQAGDFICCDNPVGLAWEHWDPNCGPPKERAPLTTVLTYGKLRCGKPRPGLGSPGSCLVFTLDRKNALVGRFERPIQTAMLVDKDVVASVNGVLLDNAE